ERSPVGDGFVWQAPLALLCFVLFVWHERRTSHPLINVRRFRDSSFSGSALTNAIAGAGLMVALVYIPVLANAAFSMNASSAALLDAVGEEERGAGASFLIIMRLVGMLVGFSLVAGFGLWEFHRATAHLQVPLPSLNPDFATQYALWLLKVKQAIFDQYHLI